VPAPLHHPDKKADAELSNVGMGEIPTTCGKSLGLIQIIWYIIDINWLYKLHITSGSSWIFRVYIYVE